MAMRWEDAIDMATSFLPGSCGTLVYEKANEGVFAQVKVRELVAERKGE